ncbi:hypothetical protein K2173_025646 [Erythroxylum novogranatense]|uniref:Hexosyltransferase n=1 Tax=Erythroxylum novogranatense TaxID=1862640 RepID=A0AAV8SB60_9ROSI|nr:hypothetical protein K2173_025646 [Erythroxylum novogranatense]
MRKIHRWQRILILSLLFFTLVAPIIFVSHRLGNFSPAGRKEFVEDLTFKYRTDAVTLNSIKQEAGGGLKEPNLVIYEDKGFGSTMSYNSSNEKIDSKQLETSGDVDPDLKQSENSVTVANHSKSNGTNNLEIDEDQALLKETRYSRSGEKEQSNRKIVQDDQKVQRPVRRAVDEKVKEIKDQLIRARTFLNFAILGGNAHLVKELRLRMKDLERVTGDANKDTDLSRRALQKMRSMEASLTKASRVFPDCSSMAKKLRAMTYNAEDQVRAQQNQAAYLVDLAARTTPKSLHCLSMRLTTEYFTVSPDGRQFPKQERVHDPNLLHFAVFTDNVLACAVVVNSTVSFALEEEKIVFHVVTDFVNFPAISMWFLLNPPGKATVQIQSIDNLAVPSGMHKSGVNVQNSLDPRYSSRLNYLRFYLPDVFPLLNKVVLLDHDVVVQGDLSGVWSMNMNGKVNGAVETCQENEASFHRMDMFINFTDPFVAKRFDVKRCTWAFGMNLFDLQEWRRQNLTDLYHKYMQLGNERPLWKAGSLPIGWATFYNQTVTLDRRWHVLGLGYESGIGQDDIDKAVVLHYDGVMKPWLDIGIAKYKGYWTKFVNYDQPHLQQCNIHP